MDELGKQMEHGRMTQQEVTYKRVKELEDDQSMQQSTSQRGSRSEKVKEELHFLITIFILGVIAVLNKCKHLIQF